MRNIPKNPSDLLGWHTHTQSQKTYLETEGFRHKFYWNTAPESETIYMDFLPIWHCRDGKYRSRHSNGPWVHMPLSTISNRLCALRGKPSHLQAGCGKRGWIGLAAGVDIKQITMTKKTNHHIPPPAIGLLLHLACSDGSGLPSKSWLGCVPSNKALDVWEMMDY